MDYFWEYELHKAADKVCREIFKLKPGETCIITADTESDRRVVDACASAAFTLGAKPMVILIASPLGVGKAADPMLPGEALTAALKEADAWIDLNNEWLLYSTPYDIAMKENKKLRHMCMIGMRADILVRSIGRINYPVMQKFTKTLYDISKAGKHFRMTNPAGTKIEFDNSTNPNRVWIAAYGYADKPGSHMQPGQIAWTPEWDTMNGIVVVDGSLDPPCGGLLKEPIRLIIEKGYIVKIEGEREARQLESWLRSLNDPNMYRLAHTSYAFNPGSQLTGTICEDERVWGATLWGFGNMGAILIAPDGLPAASHFDGVCLDSSVWVDGVQIWNEGKVVHKDLKPLAKELGRE